MASNRRGKTNLPDQQDHDDRGVKRSRTYTTSSNSSSGSGSSRSSRHGRPSKESRKRSRDDVGDYPDHTSGIAGPSGTADHRPRHPATPTLGPLQHQPSYPTPPPTASASMSSQPYVNLPPYDRRHTPAQRAQIRQQVVDYGRRGGQAEYAVSYDRSDVSPQLYDPSFRPPAQPWQSGGGPAMSSTAARYQAVHGGYGGHPESGGYSGGGGGGGSHRSDTWSSPSRSGYGSTSARNGSVPSSHGSSGPRPPNLQPADLPNAHARAGDVNHWVVDHGHTEQPLEEVYRNLPRSS